jgi:hypothetical protein
MACVSLSEHLFGGRLILISALCFGLVAVAVAVAVVVVVVVVVV